MTSSMSITYVAIRNSVLLFVYWGQKHIVRMPFILRCVHCMVIRLFLDQLYSYTVESLENSGRSIVGPQHAMAASTELCC